MSAGRLTTHVLDAAHGVPAAGVRITLYRLAPEGARHLVNSGVTNQDGRFDGPILAGAAFMPGTYELLFEAGAYFRGKGIELPDPAFLDVIPIRFGIANAGQHYHVPLLVSPYAFSTYRGS